MYGRQGGFLNQRARVAALWQSRGVRHVYECPMRWADMDLLGHVNNVIYVDYLQEARVDMLRVHARNARPPASWPRRSWWSATRCTTARR